MNEWIIPNVTKKELELLLETDIDWIIDSFDSNDITIEGNEDDYVTALKAIVRR